MPEGARETTVRRHSGLLIECELRNITDAPEGVSHFLETTGCRGKFIKNGTVAPLSTLDSAVHQRIENIDRAGRDYNNNFIFTHGQS